MSQTQWHTINCVKCLFLFSVCSSQKIQFSQATIELNANTRLRTQTPFAFLTWAPEYCELHFHLIKPVLSFRLKCDRFHAKKWISCLVPVLVNIELGMWLRQLWLSVATSTHESITLVSSPLVNLINQTRLFHPNPTTYSVQLHQNKNNVSHGFCFYSTVWGLQCQSHGVPRNIHEDKHTDKISINQYTFKYLFKMRKKTLTSQQSSLNRVSVSCMASVCEHVFSWRSGQSWSSGWY